MADESGHWYDQLGTLIASVPYADKKRSGQYRPTTLRDARKLGLLPSVTTILGTLDRPGLREWKLKWALDIARGAPQLTVPEIIEESDGYMEWAANTGSKIHLGLSEHLQGRFIHIDEDVDPVVENFWPWYRTSGLIVERAERAVVSKLGYAGTIDYTGTYFGKPCIADFKTQDFETEREANFYREHALQLAGYDEALDEVDPQDNRQWLSIIISRAVPGMIAIHDWTEERERWRSAWRNLWAFWQDANDYYPTRLFDVDRPQ